MAHTTTDPILDDRFNEAFAYAHELHRFQVRKKTAIPYLTHLMAVAGLVLENGGNQDAAIAALLHDGPEDAGGEKTLTIIRERFGTMNNSWPLPKTGFRFPWCANTNSRLKK